MATSQTMWGGLAGAEVARALGLDPTTVRALILTFHAEDVATVTVETFIGPNDVEAIRNVVAHYDLVRRDDGSD